MSTYIVLDDRTIHIGPRGAQTVEYHTRQIIMTPDGPLAMTRYEVRDVPRSRGVAVVDFRTLADGGYKYVKRGQRRGYWRVLELRDAGGPTCIHSHNVIAVLWEGIRGIRGVTDRSRYYLGTSRAKAKMFAENFNATGELS